MRAKGLLLAASLALVGCARTVVPHADDLAASCGLQLRDDERAALEAGRQEFVETCSGCHNLPVPASRSPREWAGVVFEMVEEEDVELTEQQREAIVRYLQEAARCPAP